MENKQHLLEEIPGKHDLKHVKTEDKSKPRIEKDIKIKKNKRKDLFNEVRKGNNKLKKVETKDKGKPVLDKNVHLKMHKRKELLNEVRVKGKALKKPEREKNL